MPYEKTTNGERRRHQMAHDYVERLLDSILDDYLEIPTKHIEVSQSAHSDGSATPEQSDGDYG